MENAPPSEWGQSKGLTLTPAVPNPAVPEGYMFSERPPSTATLEELDEESLVHILIKPRNALLKQYKKLFEIEGVNLRLTDSALAAIADEALKRKIGFAYWEFCSGFGLFDPSRGQWIEPLKEALLRTRFSPRSVPRELWMCWQAWG